MKTQGSGRAVISAMRYRDVKAASDWLCSAFGFERQRALSGADGQVSYAELSFGDSIIMLGSIPDSRTDLLMKQPDEIGGFETQTCYLVIKDADVHYQKARAAGATIAFDICDDAEGGRGFACRDPEGHIWNFGTYGPTTRSDTRVAQDHGVVVRPIRSPLVLTLVLVAMIVGSAVTVGSQRFLNEHEVSTTTGGSAPVKTMMNQQAAAHSDDSGKARELTQAIEAIRSQLEQTQRDKAAVELSAEASASRLANERAARESVELILMQAQRSLAQQKNETDAAQRAIKEVTEAASAGRAAKETAERNAKALQDRLVGAEMERETAKRTVKTLQTELSEERALRIAAERSAKEARPMQATSQMEPSKRATNDGGSSSEFRFRPRVP